MSDCPGIGPENKSSLWVNQLREYLQASYGSHGTGVMPIIAGINQLANSTYSVTGAYTTLHGIGPAQSGVSAGGDAIQLSPGSTVSVAAKPGDTLKIYYATFNVYSQAGFSVTIDGQQEGTYGTESTPNLATAHVVAFRVTGGLHRAAMTCNSTSTPQAACYIYGVEWTNGTHGVSVHNLGVGACRSECFGSNASMNEAWSDLISGGYRLDIIALGMNDYLHGSLSSFASYMSNFVQHERPLANAISVNGLTWTNQPGNDGNPETSFNQILQNTGADDYNDIPDYFGSFSQESSASFVNSDGIHLNDAGQQQYGIREQQHLFVPPPQ